jgi:DUF1365 family protein
VTASAIYAGTVRHRRFAERGNEFEHRLALTYLDLDELPALLGGSLVRRRPGLVRFRRSDYFGDPATPLAEAVRERVGTSGPVRLLTSLRSFGHCFNPVSFYYCFDGEELAAVLAEVTNTPWGERQAYVVRGDGAVLRGELSKRMHVSPFMPMDQRYSWALSAPGPRLSVHIENHQAGDKAFDATLALSRRELTPRGLAATAATGLRVPALIYGHALQLKLKHVRIHPHPQESA